MAFLRKLDGGPQKTELGSTSLQFSRTIKLQNKVDDIEGSVILLTSKYLVKEVNRKKLLIGIK